MKILLLPLCLSLASAWYLPQWGHPQVGHWLLQLNLFGVKDNVSHNHTLQMLLEWILKESVSINHNLAVL